jgi:subtilisin family serine protease
LFLFSVVFAAVALLASGLTPSGALLPGRAAAASSAPVADEVLAQLADSGTATFWVTFGPRSDLADAASSPDWVDRGTAVVSTLQSTAAASQADVRSLLEKRRVDFKPFWVANTIRVTAGADVLNEIAEQPGVAGIVADGAYEVPLPKAGAEVADIDAVEWNVNRVRAPEVWDGFGTRGEGAVVANIDTGVQFDHPALVNSYRGNLGDGTFDHDYNWYDPAQICGSPSTAPCDNVGHGTHTMGTMTGDDAGDNQIGVAPGSEWMAAKGCESSSCSFEALLGSAQWVLAPTDLSGANPRPDLRPHVVNNSWGGGPGDPFYREMVQAWVAAGIFPVFSNGNDGGAGCGSVGSPGDYPESYGVGAFDQADNIAEFSGRGPSNIDGSVKPDISAPGVNVRSSVPGGYDVYSGTSMAAPHVAATVALMWSAAPAVVGDVEATRALLDESAVDREDLTCGGEPGNNNIWGEGTLDAFRAVDLAPRGPTGLLSGIVTDADTGEPIAGARVEVAGPSDRRAITGADGTYELRLPVGDYDVEVSAFGYGSATAAATVTEGATTTLDVALQSVPSHTVSGTVVDDDGAPVGGATVRIVGTPLPEVVTGADGGYTIPDVPEGEYEMVVDAGGCLAAQTVTLVVDGDETVDVTLERRSDAAGYTCDHIPAGYVEGDSPLPLSGDDSAVSVGLPFNFWFYGESYDTAHVSTNGFLNFLALDGTYFNSPIPSPGTPNAAVYAFWDDLYLDLGNQVYTATLGEAPDRRFVIEWRDVTFFGDAGSRVSFEIVLHERGDIELHYRGIDGGSDQGGSATIGIENAAGDDALQYAYGEPVLSNDRGIHFDAPDAGFVTGTVTASADGAPLEGARVRALQDGTEVESTSTDGNGVYLLRLPLGTYTVEASYQGEGTEFTTVVIDEPDEPLTVDFALELAAISVAPDTLDLIVPAGETRTRTLTVGNVGDAPLEFEVFEQPVRPVGTAGPNAVPAPNRVPAGYRTTAVEPSQGDGELLLVMDLLPWGSNAMIRSLEANEIGYVQVTSDQLATIDLGQYQSVVISNDQPPSFYANYRAALPRLTAYIEDGGFLWMGAAWGWNGGSLNGSEIPGGATIHEIWQTSNEVIDNDHPTVQGVPDPLVDDAVSHAVFDNVPEGANVIMTGSLDMRPTLIEYALGAGQVLATGQYLEWAVDSGRVTGMILENTVPYVHAFDPVGDVPWLSVSPMSGTVAPGASAELEVTVDTSGLEPGLHRARVLVGSNDPRTPAVQVPVTVLVPQYQVAVDSGSLTPYTDGEGDTWAADRRFTAGGWGYTNGRSSRLVRYRPIGRTDEDLPYQTARNNPSQYRFDDVPNGTYQIELRFAEIDGRRPDRRLADVIAEQTLLLPAHDISGEVGTYNADDHTVTVAVTDGQLNVRLVPRAGSAVPILNGLRVTHLPDL